MELVELCPAMEVEGDTVTVPASSGVIVSDQGRAVHAALVLLEPKIPADRASRFRSCRPFGFFTFCVVVGRVFSSPAAAELVPSSAPSDAVNTPTLIHFLDSTAPSTNSRAILKVDRRHLHLRGDSTQDAVAFAGAGGTQLGGAEKERGWHGKESVRERHRIRIKS